MSNEQRLRLHNLVWNKHFNNSNYYPELSNKLNSIFNSFKSVIRYSIFTVERGSNQSENNWHFQGYLEFIKQTDVSAFSKKIAHLWDQSNLFFSDSQVRKGTQIQAIDYVLKRGIYFDRTSEQIAGPFAFGSPKKSISLYNNLDPEISELKGDARKLKILVNRRLKENYYDQFSDLEKDFEFFFINDKKWLREIWDHHHPVLKRNVSMAMVYWISGEPGVGKSTFADDLIFNKLGYTDAEVSFLKAPGSSGVSSKLWFDKEDSDAKVLYIEEVDKFFPKRRDLIELIDRKSRLEVKGSKVRNNFEVIVITSPNSPEQNYSWIKDETANREILRRIVQRDKEKSFPVTKFYHVSFSKDKDKFNEVIDVYNDREKIPISIKKYWQKYFNDEFKTLKDELHNINEKIDEIKHSLDKKDKKNKDSKTSFFSRLKSFFTKR